jgi:hypothetical protein
MASPQDVINPITIANYGRDAWDGVSKHNPLWAMLEKKGNIRRNVAGTQVTWPLEAGRQTPQIVTNYQDVSSFYVPKKSHVQATITWGQVANFLAVDKGMLRQNQGTEALVQYRNYAVPAMFRDLIVGTNGLGHQFFNMNGVTYSGTGDPLYGLPSVFTGNSAITWAAGSKEGTITNTNYAGLSCVLGAISVDNAQSDAWTGTAVNTTSTAWASGTANARANIKEWLSYGIARSSRFSQSDPSLNPDCTFLAFNLFQDLAYQIGEKQTFYVTGNAAASPLAFGTNKMHLMHDNLPVYWDENMVTSTGYTLNFSQIYCDVQPLISGVSAAKSPMKSASSDMFEVEVDYNDARRGITISATFPGQLRINPRYQTYYLNGA